MHASRSIRKIAAAVCMLASLSAVSFSFVSAQEATSTSFTTHGALLDGSGGSATSSNFSTIQSVGQTVNGESTSSNFVIDSGFLYFDSFAPLSQNWRWYDDETNETPTIPLAAENTAPANLADLNIIKLRISIKESAGIGAANHKLYLQYATTSDFSQGAVTVAEQANCTSLSQWCYADGAGVDGVLITTKVLSDANACASSVGTGCGTHNESATSTTTFIQQKNTITEYEFTIKGSGSYSNQVYFFRVFDGSSVTAVPLNTGATYPSISTSGAALTFSIASIATSTATEGVTTSVATSPTNVNFGALPIGASTLAAQRLTITTNASQGYKIFAYQQQGLVNTRNTQINPVDGTNGTPLGWTSGCAGTYTGCYGYHAGDDVLSGGSARFAPNDTYAQFTSSPNEISYSSGPVINKTTDIVYRVEAHNKQEDGQYTSSIVYIVVPTF